MKTGVVKPGPHDTTSRVGVPRERAFDACNLERPLIPRVFVRVHTTEHAIRSLSVVGQGSFVGRLGTRCLKVKSFGR